MSTISFSCPQCNKQFRVDAIAAGKRARCAACSHQFTVPATNQSSSGPTTVADGVLSRRTKQCRFCGEQIAIVAKKCRHCGEWLQRPEGMSTISAQIKFVAPAHSVMLTVVTLGIYQPFWLYRVFKELNDRGSTETTPGKAVGFLFIPFYNLVWIFIVWKRFGDAIAREYHAARLSVPSTSAIWLAPIGTWFALAGNFFPPFVLIQLILLPTAIGRGQGWMNQLVATSFDTLAPTSTSSRTDIQTKSCPTCGESIAVAALQCRFCNHQFSHEDITLLRQQMHQQANSTAEYMRRRNLSSRKAYFRLFGFMLTGAGTLLLFLSIVGFVIGKSDPTNASVSVVGLIGSIAIFGMPPIALGAALLLSAEKAQKELNELIQRSP